MIFKFYFLAGLFRWLGRTQSGEAAGRVSLRQITLRLVVGLLGLGLGPTSRSESYSIRQEELTFPAQIDGRNFTLQAMLYRPADAKRHPLVIFSHGRNGKDSPYDANLVRAYREVCQALATEGYVVAYIVRRGYGDSTGPDFELKDTAVLSGLEGAKDYQAAVNYWRTKDYVLPDKVLLMGQSQGGWVCLAASTVPIEGVLGVVNISGGTNYRLMGSGAVTSAVQDHWVAACGELGRQSLVPSYWVYAENDQSISGPTARRMFDAFTVDPTGGVATLLMLPPYGSNGHAIVGVPGLFMPSLKEFFAVIGFNDLPDSPPAFVAMSGGESLALGGTAVLNATLNGFPTPVLQWRKDGVNLANGGNLSGANRPTLRIINLQAADAGAYTLVATNALGTAISFPIGVEFPPAGPVIVTQPQNQVATSGASASFALTVGGNPPPGLQWQRLPAGAGTWADLDNGGAYSGVMNASLLISPASIAMSGDQFRCVSANAQGTITSNAVQLTVTAPVPAPVPPANGGGGGGGGAISPWFLLGLASLVGARWGLARAKAGKVRWMDRARIWILGPMLILLPVLTLPAATLTWDLPAQPAADALLAFSTQSGYQVLFSAKELAGVQSRPVQGGHEPLAALQILLAGSNFEAVPTGETRVVVRARPLSRITGLVVAGAKGDGLAGATVTIEGLGLSATTGRNGRFQLARVPAGTHTVVVSAAGLQTVRITGLVLEAGSNLELKPVALETDGGAKELSGAEGAAAATPLIKLEDMVVTPSRFGVAEGPALPNATLTHEDLELLPQLGEDLYRAIGRLPGLATLDYSAKFWVRGAPNEQVLARLDGLTLLEPYHIKDVDGALAIIDIETVARLDLISGGFTAEYGDRLAGVLRMETATPTAAQPRTTLGLSLTGLRATNRGTFAGGKGSWMLSGRMGYPDIAIDAANDDDGAVGETKIRYYDLFGKMEYQLAPGQVLGLHVLHAADTFSIRETLGRNLTNSYDNNHVWARWQAEFPSDLKGETVLAYSALNWHRRGTGVVSAVLPFDIRDDRDLKLAALRSDWSQPVGDRSLLRGGLELQSGSAQYRYHRLRSLRVIRNGEVVIDPRVIDRNPEPEGMNNGGHAAWRFQPVSRLTLESGLRYDWSDYGAADGGWSPRFNAALDLGHETTLRAAWGRYRQQQGLHEIDVMDNESIIYPAERAEQRVLGLETVLGGKVSLRAEIYQRITANPRPHGENLAHPFDVLGEVLYDRVLLRPSHAEARGFELIAESRGQNRFDWSASYALAETVETIGGREVPRRRDQRHTFHTDLFYRPNPRWQFTASWQYHTGWPTTAENFSNLTLPDGRVVINSSFGPVNGERLPAYHRLDLRATRTFQLRHGTLRAFVDVFNAYDQANVESYSTLPQGSGAQLAKRQVPQSLLPILPSAGLIWDF